MSDVDNTTQTDTPEPSAADVETTAPPADEPKYARRRAGLLVFLAIGAIALVALSLLGYRSFTARLAAAEKLDRATALVEDADEIVVRVDSVVRATVTPTLAASARDTSSDVTEAEKLITEALVLVDEAMPALNDSEQERAELLRESATTRQRMLAGAPALLDLNTRAATAMPLAEQGWEKLLEATKLSDAAVAEYNKLTNPGVKESQRLNKQAAEVLDSARELFVRAEESFPAAPFELYIAYVDARMKLNRLSQQSDTTWLKGDIEKANSVIEDYNKDDKAAVEQAKKLPGSTSAAIAQAFEAAAKQATQEYYAARDAALEADAKLRAY